jgi:3-oxoadipate enol-lactonase
MTFARVNDLTFHYKVEGNSKNPALVFVNSLGADLRIWDDVVPYLDQSFLIIRYDKRGHGLSDCPSGPYSITDHAEDLAGLLAHLGVKTAIVAGLSVGGMIALDFASRMPQKIAALILCDTAAKIGTPDYWNERIESIQELGMEEMAQVIIPRWFGPSYLFDDPAGYQGHYNMLVRTPMDGYIATCEGIRDADLREVVGTIETQVLVLCGAEDSATPPDLVRGLAEALPDSQFALIEGAGHTPCVERPEAMALKMKQFLRTHGYDKRNF